MDINGCWSLDTVLRDVQQRRWRG